MDHSQFVRYFNVAGIKTSAQTLNPKAYTLNPKTQNPKTQNPKTLNPKPQNPKPYTLNPKTLKPKPVDGELEFEKLPSHHDSLSIYGFRAYRLKALGLRV